MKTSYFFMDKRLKKINQRLSEYSLGRFEKQLALSPLLDEMDAVVSGINMLGEELKSITISRNYFTSIFNAVSDMVFVLNAKGRVEAVNRSAEEQLQYEPGSLNGKKFNELHQAKGSFFHRIKKQLLQHPKLILPQTFLHTRQGGKLYVKIHAAHFNNEQQKELILLTASDISLQVQGENLIIRAIIDTQEKERQRLAKDLHDSLTQQLSAIKFYISSMNNATKNKLQKEILLKSNEALTEVIADMRNICFNLMPGTLQEFGLIKAVQEFCSHFALSHSIRFDIRQNRQLPDFPDALTIDLYRVVQEFISNAIRHGQANSIRILFRYSPSALCLLLADNGAGFNPAEASAGMGLQNVHSRVKSHHGNLSIESAPGKGTSYRIVIPMNQNYGNKKNSRTGNHRPDHR